MKKLLLNLALLFLGTMALGQTIYTGKVEDSKKTPIAYANVVAFKVNGNQLLTGVITNDNGTFELKVTTKEPFYIEVSFIGFETQKINPEKNNLGVIILKEDATILKDVVVTARKKLIKQKVDRLVFNVENSMASSGGSALDVLKATPSVQINRNNINIVGKSSVRVLVNDRIVKLSGEELVNYLTSFASDDIKNIEVITTPPAKYEAEGNGGLINIILKKPKDNSWSNQVRASYFQTTYPAVKIGNTFNYNHKKWKILASLDAKKGHSQRKIATSLYYPNQTWKDTIINKEAEDYLSAKLGVDYQVSPKASIGFLYSGNYQEPNSKEHSNVFILNTNNQKISNIRNNGFTDQNSQNNSLNIHYLQNLDTLGRKMSIDLDYFNYQNDKNRKFSSRRTGNLNSYQKSKNTGDQDITNYSAKIDFQHPSKFAYFSYGGKITQTKTNNEVKFFDLTNGNTLLDMQKSNIFEYTENIQALYVDMKKDFSAKWQMKLGLRSEFTQTKGFSKSLNQTDKRNYVKLFPTLYVNYMKNPNNIFNLSYSRRTDRPSFYRLNPFKFYINANSYVEGNPSLQPDFSHNIDFQYIFKGRFITKLFYAYVEGASSQVPKVDVTNNNQYYTFENIGNVGVYGLTQTILYNPFKWWNTTNMIAGFYKKTNVDSDINLGTNKFFNGWQYQLYSNHSFLLNRKGTIQAEATFYANSKNPQFIYDVEPMWFLDLGLKMQFLDRKLQVTAKLNDVFKTSTPNSTTYTNGVKQIYNNYNDNRYFTLGLTYKFGNKKIRVKERSLGNKEELNRTN